MLNTDRKPRGDPNEIIAPSFGSPARSATLQALYALEAEKLALNAKITHLRANLASIHLIPPEILCEIFILCLPEDFKFRMDASVLHKFNVLVVCRKWREMVHSNPRFWRRMEFDFSKLTESNVMNMLQPLAAWLERATAELSIEWCHDTFMAGILVCGVESPIAMLQKLLSKSWTSLKFIGPLEELCLILNPVWKMDALSVLKIDTYPDGGFDAEGDSRYDTAVHFPRLKILHLDSADLVRAIKAPILIELRITRMHVVDWNVVAIAYPSLEVLGVLSGTNIRIGDESHSFANIKCLEFENTNRHGSPICRVNHLNMPQLTYLKINGRHCESIKIDFTAHSIQTFHLFWITFSRTYLTSALLLALPSLQHIMITGCTNATMTIMGFLADDSSVCPNISDITLSDTSVKREDIVAFLTQREPHYADETGLLEQRRTAHLVTLASRDWDSQSQKRGTTVSDVKDADHSTFNMLQTSVLWQRVRASDSI